MKTFKNLVISLMALLFTVTTVNAQSKLDVALSHIQSQKNVLGLQDSDLSEYVVTDQYTSKHNGVTHIYLQQQINGIGIRNAIININVDKNNRVLNVGNRFVPNVRTGIVGTSPRLTASQALLKAAEYLKVPITKAITTTPTQLNLVDKPQAQHQLLSDAGIAIGPIPAKLNYVRVAQSTVYLAWDISIYMEDQQNEWIIQVDAQNGNILDVYDNVLKCEFDLTPIVTDAPVLELRNKNASARLKNTKTVFSPFISTVAPSLAPFANFQSGTYRALRFPIEGPSFGALSLITNAEDAEASPNGWHDDGNGVLPTTRGNNVWAYNDRPGGFSSAAGSYGIGYSPFGGEDLIFDFPADFSADPVTYIDAATTNLFYVNNVIHDILYFYGFDEVSGNFQHTNFTGQGRGLDAVHAQAQDGGGTNNANFRTPSETGIPPIFPPTMQMFLWTSALPARLVTVNSPANVAGSFIALEAAFGRRLNSVAIRGRLVVGDPVTGCTGLTPGLPAPPPKGAPIKPYNNATAMAGNIAIVRRGDCSFFEKIASAQASGALGVIVVNNAGGPPIAMGGDETGNTVVIPAVMISKADGDKLIEAALASNVNVSLVRNEPAPAMRDGDFDNGVIAHEYGHGISIRLTGGPGTSCLNSQEQAGEGWSDYFAVMTTMKPGDTRDKPRGVGSYVVYQEQSGSGIRPRPYSTNMAVNEYTYKNISNPEITVPHGVGFIFNTMLWEMTWNLIDKHGFDPDLYRGKGGNNIALQLVVDGFKLQPCAPGFVDSRDAILLADMINNNGANQLEIWKAFAKRGLGFGASQGSPNDRTDGTESFLLPPQFRNRLTVNVKANPERLVRRNSTINYTLTVENTKDVAVSNVLITDSIPSGFIPVPGSLGDATFANGKITFPVVALAVGEKLEKTYQLIANTGTPTVFYFQDDIESGTSKWTTVKATGDSIWRVATNKPFNGTKSWFVANPATSSLQYLQIKDNVELGDNALLRFRHLFNTESNFDGGTIEISTNNGTSWTDLGNRIITNRYNGFKNSSIFNNPVIPSPVASRAFSGNSVDYLESVVDLSEFAGQNVKIRFVFQSDPTGGREGWYVDDINIISGGNLSTNFVTATTELGDKEVVSVSTEIFDNVITSVNTKRVNYFASVIFPNPANDQLSIRLADDFIRNVKGDVVISITNAFGQNVFNARVDGSNASNGYNLDISKLPAGIYSVQILNNENMSSQKLIIQK